MYKFYIFLVAVLMLVLIVFSSYALASSDYIWVYKDENYTTQATAFDDGDTVYIKVTDYVTSTISATATVTNISIEYSIEVPLTNSETPTISEDPTLYFGEFKIQSSWENLQENLRMLSGQTATITVDLDGLGDAATAQIVALYTPPPPTNLKAKSIAGGRIKLSWDASSPQDTVEKYNIYRGTTPGGEDYTNPIHEVLASGSSYEWIDSDVEMGRTYYYTVKAEDRTGDESEASGEASAKAKKKLLVCDFKSKVVRSDSPLKVVFYVSGESSRISIKVFNLNGEIVKEDHLLASSEEEVEWSWNGKNMFEQKVNNGVYILLIEATDPYGEKEVEKKIIGVLF